MPSPSSQLARPRPDIAATFEDFDVEANANAMICTKLLPVFEANQAAGNFGRIRIADLLEEADVERSSGSGYSRGKYNFEDVHYATKDYGREEPVDDRDAEIYKDYFVAEEMSGKRARSTVLIEQEKRAAAATFGNGSINTTASTAAWSVPATATPVTDINTAILATWGRTGLWCNAVVMSYELFRYCRLCDEVTDQIKSAGAGDQARTRDVTVAQLAEVFDVEHVLVAGASRNTADKGQSASIAQIWDRTKCMVTRIATSSDLKEPCLGRTFHWAADGSTIGGTVESYRDETVRSEIIRARHETHEKVIYTEAAQILTGCLS